MNELLQMIQKTMANSSLTEPFYKAVFERLVSLGYEMKENDDWVLCFTMQKVENHIKNSCNITSIPDGLFNIAVDKVCGEFLLTKKQSGKLTIADLDLDGAITSIHEGDTTIQFANGSSDEEKFTQLLNYLSQKGEGDFICYRKLKW